MRILELQISNIGPFKSGNLEFISDSNQMEKPPVIFITGENGTGKSIVIDAIRTAYKGRFGGGIERDITSSDQFSIDAKIYTNGENHFLKGSKKFNKTHAIETNHLEMSKLFLSGLGSTLKKNFIFDYWTSKLSNDTFKIDNITSIDPDKYLDESLSGVHKNIDLTKIISFFDYLKDSRNGKEAKLGKELYELLEKIINISISEGSLSYVSRIDLKPIIKIGKNEISLDKLSSGNLYLIQRFCSLLSQVYSICSLNQIDIKEYKKIEGVLIIDEAENHLHPKWQKVFLKNILDLFPRLQIIVTTHSPFIVSSIKNSRVYVCKSKVDYSIIEEETDLYSNKPVEEVLMSPLFNTSNFNIEISRLIDARKQAIIDKNEDKVKKIEAKLKQSNPEYFNYLNIEELIKSIKK